MTYSNFLLWQTDRGLFYWPNRTRLSKEEAEEEGGAFLRIVLFDLHYHKSKNLKYIFVIFSPGAW